MTATLGIADRLIALRRYARLGDDAARILGHIDGANPLRGSSAVLLSLDVLARATRFSPMHVLDCMAEIRALCAEREERTGACIGFDFLVAQGSGDVRLIIAESAAGALRAATAAGCTEIRRARSLRLEPAPTSSPGGAAA